MVFQGFLGISKVPYIFFAFFQAKPKQHPKSKNLNTRNNKEKPKKKKHPPNPTKALQIQTPKNPNTKKHSQNPNLTNQNHTKRKLQTYQQKHTHTHAPTALTRCHISARTHFCLTGCLRISVDPARTSFRFACFFPQLRSCRPHASAYGVRLSVRAQEFATLSCGV